MSSDELVDQEYRDLLGDLPQFDFDVMDLTAIRSMIAEAMPGGEADPDVLEEEILLPARDRQRELRLLVYRPRTSEGKLPALLHFHPGGHVIGSADMSASANRSRALRLGCIVVSVDYGLSPEHPYPAALHEGLLALEWLHSDALGGAVDTRRIAVGGESAGAGVAASLALLARDRGLPSIVFQLLVYPMLDDRTVAREDSAPTPHVGMHVWTRSNNRFAWNAYLGSHRSTDSSDYAAPARATDLTGLPPTFIAVGALDLFVEEDIDFARRLIRAGVPTEFHVYPGAFHGFDLVPGTKLTTRLEMDCESALRAAFEQSADWQRQAPSENFGE